MSLKTNLVAGAFSRDQRMCAIIYFEPRIGELRTQKLKSRLVRTRSLNVFPLKAGVGWYMTLCQKFLLKSGQFYEITYPESITLEENMR